MSDVIKEFETWEAVIKNYIANLGDESKKDEYHSYLLSNFYYERLQKAKVINVEDEEKLAKELKKINKITVTCKNKNKLKKYYDEFINNKWIQDSSSREKFIERKNCFYNIWINQAMIKGNDYYPATHIAKLTHSSSGASSINDKSSIRNNRYISTSALTKKALDGAYADAKFSKEVKFLMLTHNQKMLSDEIEYKNNETLKDIAENEEELSNWISGFGKIINPSPKGDGLAKQIYFPVRDDHHLLTILKSSTLAHAIFETFFEKTARKRIDDYRKSKINKKYQIAVYAQPVSIARLSTTLSQPQNVSVLNGKRSGFLRLFSDQPPTWQSQLKPPIKNKSLFGSGFYLPGTNENIDYLREYLLRFERVDLSIKSPERLKWIERWVRNITDEFLTYVARIQKLPAGWSHVEDIALKQEHQYLLDPFRQDDEFQAALRANDWQAVVCDDFGWWLNNRLLGKDKKFTPQPEHRHLWAKLLEAPLREHNDIVQSERKRKAGVGA